MTDDERAWQTRRRLRLLTCRERIARALATEGVPLRAYAIADLDDFFFPYRVAA